MTFLQTDQIDKATVFHTIVSARDIGIKAAGKWQMHFMIVNAEPPRKGFCVRLANGCYLRALTGN